MSNPYSSLRLNNYTWDGGQVTTSGATLELEDTVMACTVFAANVQCPADAPMFAATQKYQPFSLGDTPTSAQHPDFGPLPDAQPKWTGRAPSLPTPKPTAKPKGKDTGKNTAKPKGKDTVKDTAKPKGKDTGKNTAKPKGKNTANPTKKPKGKNAAKPTAKPTPMPTSKSKGKGKGKTEPTPTNPVSTNAASFVGGMGCSICGTTEMGMLGAAAATTAGVSKVGKSNKRGSETGLTAIHFQWDGTTKPVIVAKQSKHVVVVMDAATNRVSITAERHKLPHMVRAFVTLLSPSFLTR